MKTRNGIFDINKSTRGSMLVELLLSVALFALIIPFVFQYQTGAVRRAENIAVARQMQSVQGALERYIVANRDNLLATVGRSITRVEMADLSEYGVPEFAMNNSGDYQLRILKSSDSTGQATLQGVVVLTSQDITPVRTREIVNLGGGSMGFVDGNRAYGTFGAWHADATSLGLQPGVDGIVETTPVNRGNALYLWRVPSNNASDATMMSALNLGGHNVVDAKFFDGNLAGFSETLHVGTAVTGDMIFDNRTTVDHTFETGSATVSGVLSADSCNLEVAGTFTLADVGKFSSFTTGDLRVSNLTLSGLSVDADDDDAAVLKINKALDMTGGRIDAMYATVGFAGSITPRLVVKKRIEDSVNPAYYWDAAYRVANFSDVNFPGLNDMATLVAYRENGSKTESGRLFGSVAANKNATAADFMNAITEMQQRVRAKYRLLNLE